MSNKKNRVGEKFTNNENLGTYKFIIVEYNNYRDVWIEFQDEYKARVHTQYDNCKSGRIKNPYHPSVYGCGYLGLHSDGSRPKTKIDGKKTREYVLWENMLQRCYSSKYHEKCPTYKNATVCKRWLCFANFLEDIKLVDGYELWRDNPNQYISLDKDIKGNDSKVYSLETCMFVTNEENLKERHERYNRGYK